MKKSLTPKVENVMIQNGSSVGLIGKPKSKKSLIFFVLEKGIKYFPKSIVEIPKTKIALWE